MIEREFSVILAIYSMLLVFGIVYNALVSWCERRGYLEGFTWLAVVVGTAGTVLGIAIIDWRAALITLGAFAASGLPMAGGAIWRYVRRRGEEQKDVRQAAALAEQRERS